MEEEEEAHLQRHPRRRDVEQNGEGSGPGKDNILIPNSTVLEPRQEADKTERLEAVNTVQQELEQEQPTSLGLQT